MHQVAIAPDQVRDPFEKNVPGHRRRPRRLPHADAMGRDAHAGFSTASPGCRLPTIFVHENVANLEADTQSILNLYKALIALRKNLAATVTGSYVPIAAQGDLLLYRREHDGEGYRGRAQSRRGAGFDLSEFDRRSAAKSCFRLFLDRAWRAGSERRRLDLRGNEGVDHVGGDRPAHAG